MGLIELNPPPLRSARVKRIPSGVQVDTPDKAVRLRLPRNATSLDFLRAVYRHPRMPLETRIECANLALPFEHPKLLAVVANHAGQNDVKVIIQGGLPRLPGSTTFPS
jgi:hypothetical protein